MHKSLRLMSHHPVSPVNSGQTVADLLPIDKITAIKQGNSGEVLETAVYKIKTVVGPTYTRIRMKPFDHRILISLGVGFKYKEYKS